MTFSDFCVDVGSHSRIRDLFQAASTYSMASSQMGMHRGWHITGCCRHILYRAKSGLKMNGSNSVSLSIIPAPIIAAKALEKPHWAISS
jgi:hypothetical protein